MSKYKPTPPGVALHSYVLKPDAKFNPENPIFKTKLVLDRSAPGVAEFLASLDAAVEEAFAAETKDLPVAQKKLWKTYLPYADQLDDETGEPTGKVVVSFKQNAKIKRRDGTMVDVKILVQDASGKRLEKVPVYSGDVIRVGYSVRPSKIATDKKIGVRLDFGMVRILNKAERGSDVFGGAEDGWTAEDHADDFNASAPAGDSGTGSPSDSSADF